MDCGEPDHHFSTSLKVLETTEGSVATYECAMGYQYLNGGSNRICQSNGQWSGITPQCTQIGKCLLLMVYLIIRSRVRVVYFIVDMYILFVRNNS